MFVLKDYTVYIGITIGIGIISLIPRPTRFFALQFALTIMHGSGRAPLPCVIVNANRSVKNREVLGTRLFN